MKKPWESFSAVDKFFDPLLNKTVNRWVLLLPTMNPCHWYLKCGGCTMCGFNGPKSSKQQYAWITDRFGKRALHFLYWLGYFSIKRQNPQNLTIYNGGSFLNCGREVPGSISEIPYSLQATICRHVNRHPTIQKLFVESRPEFVSENKIKELSELLSGKTLEVGIGLESKNDRVRNVILKKGICFKQFEDAICILKRYSAKSLAYVFFKPMELSESKAIDDAISSIQYCFKLGVDEVSLSCAFIQDETEMAEQYQKNLYQLPWLWSIIEIIKKTAPLGPVRIGTFEDDPKPIDVPHNCHKCTERVTKIIDQYRHTFDLSLFNQLQCSCQETWLKEISAQ